MLALITCGVINVSATTLSRTVSINSGNAVTFGIGTKSTDTAKITASLNTIGDVDDVLFWTYTSDSTSVLSPVLLVREGQTASVNYISGKPSYAGLGVKILVRSDTFSFGSYSISGSVNIY